MEKGQYLRALRKSKNLSLREAARRAGVSHSYLSQVETGSHDRPSIEILEKLSVVYDKELSELLEGTGHIKTIKTGYYHEFEDVLREEMELRNKKDIMYLLQNKDDNAYYNGQMLSQEDRQRVLTVLENLLPEYHKS
jgi:transcriptional regulator with XRE-family HTH domain